MKTIPNQEPPSGGSDHRLVRRCTPNCGTEPELMESEIGYKAYWYKCPKCGQDGPARFDKDEARIAWNGHNRPPNEQSPSAPL